MSYTTSNVYKLNELIRTASKRFNFQCHDGKLKNQVNGLVFFYRVEITYIITAKVRAMYFLSAIISSLQRGDFDANLC